MAGWDSNWADTKAFEKRPFNVLKQLSDAIAERALLVGYIGGNVPFVVTVWDSSITYGAGRPWYFDFVVKDYNDRGVWNSGTGYVKYDKVSKYTAMGEWSKITAYKKYEHIYFTSTTVTKWVAKQNNTNKPPVVLAWVVINNYVTDDYVTRTNLGVTKTYIALQPSVGKDPLAEPTYWSEVVYNPLTYWWTYAEAPHRYFYAKKSSTNKDPYTETADWAVDGASDIPCNVFRSRDIGGNINKDPFTETSYWSVWWPWDVEHYQYILMPNTLPSLPITLPYYNWFYYFQDWINKAFTVYINHTYNGGDLNGAILSDVFWTEATMLNAVGDLQDWSGIANYVVGDYVFRSGSSYRAILPGTNKDPLTEPTYWTLGTNRIPAPTAFKQIRAWAWQQYKIINMLRWGIVRLENGDGSRYYRQGSSPGYTVPPGMPTSYSAAYAAARAAYDVMPWTLTSSPAMSPAWVRRNTLKELYWLDPPGTYRWYVNLTNTRHVPQYSFTNGLPVKFSIFFLGRAYKGDAVPPHDELFLSSDGYEDMKCYVYGKDDVERTIPTGIVNFQVNIEQSVIAQIPVPPISSGETGWRYEECKFRVANLEFTPDPNAWSKFVFCGDGPDGFEFKDW